MPNTLSESTEFNIDHLLTSLPDQIIAELQKVSESHGLTITVLTVAILSIISINRGSAKYAELSDLNTKEENRLISNRAAGQILPGVTGMAVTAFTAANPLFAFPEITAVMGAVVQYLSTVSEKADNTVTNLRLRGASKIAAIGFGVGTIIAYADSFTDVLPVFGLTALTYAFVDARNQLYRYLTISGGLALVLGSGVSLYNSVDINSPVGIVMSAAFFTLNALFTKNEIELARKDGKLDQLLDKVFNILSN